MRTFFLTVLVLLAASGCRAARRSECSGSETRIILFPADGAVDVNPDTHLLITFPDSVTAGDKGLIRVVDVASGRIADKIDMSIPAGPTEPQEEPPGLDYTPVAYNYDQPRLTNRDCRAGTPSGANAVPAWMKSSRQPYQLDIIGSFTDAFHFYPVITRGRQAMITLHHNMLDYGRLYEVIIDKGVIKGAEGAAGKKITWRFTTKSAPPSSRRLTVSADGTGDFSTLQGAMDFIPDGGDEPWTVFIRDGDYEEIVYFRNKRNVTIEGESREGVLIHYANNEVFNPHPFDIKTNEWRGTFPSRRAAVAADHCSWMTFRNLTFQTDCKGQAEGFLISGDHNFLDNVEIIGSGDALQANGSCYLLNCIIRGDMDTVLGRGPCFFNHCVLESVGAFMWIRNTKENHGNIFLDCSFRGKGPNAYLCRLPDNRRLPESRRNYPYAECVLLGCTLDSIPPEGFYPVGDAATDVHLWEFNSHDSSGRPVDTSQRTARSRRLDAIADMRTIADYSNPLTVLGW